MKLATPNDRVIRRDDLIGRRHRLLPLAADGDGPVVGEIGMADLAASAPLRAAAVLVGLIERRSGSHLVLTRRTERLRAHSGQVALPGGRIDPDDASPVAAALREAEEEIGLPPAAVEPIGRLPGYATCSGFLIHPVVGLIAGAPELVGNPDEVADVFEVPLAFAMNPANHRIESRLLHGVARRFYVMGEGERRIWGVTAGILRLLYEEVFR